MDDTDKGISGVRAKAEGGGRAFLRAVKQVVGAELGDSSFTVEHLAQALGVSTRQLYRRLDEQSASPPGALLRRMRLERAAQLLDRDCARVSDAARAVGFKDTRHFSKLFRQTFGILPAQYRDRQGRARDGFELGRFSPPE